MPPINLLNYHLLGDRKPHSRETMNRVQIKAVERKQPREFMRSR